jgi:hypothetical protein
MTLSFLARWDTPGGAPGYRVVRDVDALASGALGGRFLQVAPVVDGDMLYMFGTGDYRRSGVSLARRPAAAIEDASGDELYDRATGTWGPPLAQGPLVETDGVGELSVQRVADDVFVMLYQRELRDADGDLVDNRVLVRVAHAPVGPWSDAATVVDMADAAFRAAHCCGALCEGAQVLHCDRAGLYGAYALPFIVEDGASLVIPFVVSTWDPYNVALFTTRVNVGSSAP